MNTIARIAAFALALAVLTPGPGSLTSLRAEPPTKDDLAGSTWELVSFKYGDSTEWENVPGIERKLKMLTATHFVWVSYETASGEIQNSGGGTYTFAGAIYTEVIDFGTQGMTGLRGQKQIFSFDLKGDRLEQTGKLSNGTRIAEVWQRVR